jgi:hypothetical protein
VKENMNGQIVCGRFDPFLVQIRFNEGLGWATMRRRRFSFGASVTDIFA